MIAPQNGPTRDNRSNRSTRRIRRERIRWSLAVLAALGFAAARSEAQDGLSSSTPEAVLAAANSSLYQSADSPLSSLSSASAPSGSSSGGRMVPYAMNAASVWFRAEYLSWWIKGNESPALVTTSPNGTPQSGAGVLPAAQVLAGNGRLDSGMRSGARSTLGYWFDDANQLGVEVTWFELGNSDSRGDFFAQSSGEKILARPFYNTALGAQDAELVAYPGLLAGSVRTSTSSGMDSAGVLLRRALRQGPQGQIDLIAGYRHLRYREGLGVQEDLVSTNPGGLIQQGTTIGVSDTFATHNDFEGAELGAAFWFSRGRWTFDGDTKLGFGNAHQTLYVNGSTVVTTPGGSPVESAGGLLALPSNSGHFTRNRFALLPELDLNVRRQLTRQFSVTTGYSLLFLTSVLRTGDQIDTKIDSTQLPFGGGGFGFGSTHPAPIVHDTSLLAQGLSLGLEYRR